MQVVQNNIIRILLLVIGSLSIVLGIIGIFLPLLPTTPFLLLAAGCYARSSSVFYNWLISHPVLSKYILGYLEGKGIPRRAKLYTFSIMWLTILISAVVIPLWEVRILLILIAAAVSTYIWRLPEPGYK